MPRRKTPTFEEFWKAYPVHKAKGDAERAWKRVRAADKVKAVDGIAAYRDECLRTGVAMCYGHGYLNGRRWEDEPEGTTGTAPASTPPPPPEEMETW